MKYLTISLLGLLLTACSTKQIYNAVQENQRSDCRQYVNAQYDDCMRQYNTPYEDYEESRQESLRAE